MFLGKNWEGIDSVILLFILNFYFIQKVENMNKHKNKILQH